MIFEINLKGKFWCLGEYLLFKHLYPKSINEWVEEEYIVRENVNELYKELSFKGYELEYKQLCSFIEKHNLEIKDKKISILIR